MNQVMTSVVLLIPGKTYTQKDFRIPILITYQGVTHREYVIHILKEATKDDYINYLRSESDDYNKTPWLFTFHDYFYEVSFD